jgi:hypothetical protein
VTKGFEKCCISDEVDGGKLRMLATNMRVWAMNMRQRVGTEDTKVEAEEGMMKKLRLVKMNQV